MGGSDPRDEQESEQVVEGTAVKTPEQATPSDPPAEGGGDLRPGDVEGEPPKRNEP
jgi:hypothetical protein